MSWDEIAERHGTDKCRAVGFGDETQQGHGYMDHYERLLAGRRIERMVEIGVYEGASLRTWATIWPDAEIWGVDIDPALPVAGATIVHADARDGAQLYAEGVPWVFDLVVDDSNHLRGVVRGAMDNFRPRLTRGGLYVVEDCRTGWPHRADSMVISTEEAEELLVAHGLYVVEVVPSLLSVDGYQAAMVVAQAP